MVNIELSLKPTENRIRIIVKGHAGQAEKGKDLVCSAVSILTYTIAENVKRLCRKHIGAISLDEGESEIDIFLNSDEEYKDFVKRIEAVSIGFEILAESYPEYVTFNVNGKGESLNI